MTIARARGRLRRALAAAWGLRRNFLSDSLVLGGACAVVYGLALVHVPSAWIVAGALALATGWRLEAGRG